ncbi:MAG: CDGSH iron-sulfur domain-containing protein [Planctomycetia bacterium]|nr:CDGSH iron-sulfur domain-containing protein [Planctomycetia bacterium]
MSEVVIRTRKNGPLVIAGPFTLVDADGNPFTLPTDKPLVALCRCGHSQRRPFCDGSHKDCGFIAEESALPPQ